MQHLETVMTLLSALAALVIVLALAYLTIRWMSGKMSGPRGSRVIRVLDRIMIGQDKCLLVVRVADQSMLIGMSGDAVVKLCDLPELDDDADLQAAQQSVPEFADVLREAVSGGWNKLMKKGKDQDDQGRS